MNGQDLHPHLTRNENQPTLIHLPAEITAQPPLRLSLELAALAKAIQAEELSLRELMSRLGGRVYTLLLVFLSLPFCLPVSIPGLSTPFGVIIILLGARFAIRQKPWLPQRLLNLQVPTKLIPLMLRVGGRMVRMLEGMLRPRMTVLFEYRTTQFLAGVVICISGSLLLLPLPIPFTNFFPAFTVVLIALSFSTRDGLMLGMGALMFIATILFFTVIVIGGANAVAWLESHFSGIFDPNDESGELPSLPQLDDG